MPEFIAVMIVLVVLLLFAYGFKQWLLLSDCCPSCKARFNEARADIYCRIGEKRVRFCYKCTTWTTVGKQ